MRNAAMRNWHWIVIGSVVGVCSGAIFGMDYAIVGFALGVIAGGAIMFGMNRGS